MPYKDPEAQKAQRRRHYQANKEAYAARMAAWRAANPERNKQIMAEWVAANPDKVKSNRDAWRERNPGVHSAYDPAARAVVIKRWTENHPEYTRVANARRRANKSMRTPAWVGELDQLVFREAADLAVRRTAVLGIEFEVDHQIPLRGKHVSGLHVWNNLQVIPLVVNRRKSNRYSA